MISATNGEYCGFCEGFAVFTQAASYEHASWYWMKGESIIQFGGDSLTGLCADFYTLQLYDSLTHTVHIESFAIGNDGIMAGAVAHQNTSINNCDGTINVINIGGSDPIMYSYSEDPPLPPNTGMTGTSTTGNWTDLCAGIYSVIIIDGGACSVALNNIVIEAEGPLTSNLETSDYTSSTCGGTALVSPTGGTPPYTINWSNGNASSNIWDNGVISSTMNDLCEGTYFVTITDAAGDSITESYTITNLLCAGFNASVTANSIPNSCQSNMSVSVSGGTPPYAYTWSNGATSSGVSNLCDGTYSVMVTDANGCISSTSDIIIGDSCIGFTVSITANNLSNCQSSLYAFASGGTPPYEYDWSNGGSDSSILNLCNGSYTVIVNDANNCVFVANSTINVDPCNEFNASVTANSIPNSCQSSMSLSVSGGMSPYAYLWSNGATTPSVSNLCDGTYSVMVTDANGCISSTSDIILGDSSIQQTPIVSNLQFGADTTGTCAGWAGVTPLGGNAPYTYSWSTSETTPVILNLCAGNYSVIIVDANGDSLTEFFTINNTYVDPCIGFYAYPTANNLGNCQSNMFATVSGGTPPYSYLWSTGETTMSIQNLCDGTYSFYATDANGCTSATNDIIIGDTSCVGFGFTSAVFENTAPNACTGYIINVTPQGGSGFYSFVWSNGSTTPDQYNLCPGNYSVLIMDVNGCTTMFNQVIAEDSLISADLQSNLMYASDSLGGCNGAAVVGPVGGTAPYSIIWSTGLTDSTNLLNLCDGTYSVTIIDAAGDTLVETFTLGLPVTDPCESVNPNVAANYTTPAGTCQGSIPMGVFGGTPPYTYLLPASVTDLCAGTYTIYIADAAGCAITGVFSITEDSSSYTPMISNLVAGGDSDTSANCDGYASVNPQSGTAPYTVSWSTGETGTAIDSLCAGVYSVTISDAAGDTITETFVVSDPESTYGNTPYGDTNIVGNIYFDLVENCDIDYSSIDSATLYAAVLDSVSMNLYVTWAVYSPNDTIYISDTIGFNGGNGIYNLTISVFCPQKSNDNYFSIIGQIYIEGNQNVAELEEKEMLSVTAYPNPFSDAVIVKTGKTNDYIVTLSDALGRTIQVNTFEQTEEFTVQPVHTLASGNYFLTIESQSGTAVVKLVH